MFCVLTTKKLNIRRFKRDGMNRFTRVTDSKNTSKKQASFFKRLENSRWEKMNALHPTKTSMYYYVSKGWLKSGCTADKGRGSRIRSF